MRNHFPSRELVKSLRDRYPEGTPVELVSMSDPFTQLQPGDKGVIGFVDDIGTIHVNWDGGSTLGVAYGEDSIRRLEPDRDKMEGQAGAGHEYLRNAELGVEQNYNMVGDGLINNLPAPRADLTDGQTWDEIQELAPETIPDTGAKASLLEQVESDKAGLPGPEPAAPGSHTSNCRER